MLALLSSPVRRWLLASLLLPRIAFVLSKVGLYLQRRNGGAPTRLSRAVVGVGVHPPPQRTRPRRHRPHRQPAPRQRAPGAAAGHHDPGRTPTVTG